MAVISERRGPVIGLQPAGLGRWCWRWRSPLTRGAAGARRRCGWPGSPSSTCRWCCCSARRSSRARRRKCCWRCSGAPLLAALTLALLGGYRALAVGVGADGARLRGRRDRRLAADVALAARAQPGPRRPLLRDRQRARGAAGGAGRRRHRGGAGRVRAARSRHAGCAVAFLGVGLVAAFVFAAGRFGADVGAAIVFPVGAAVAAAAIAGAPAPLGAADRRRCRSRCWPCWRSSTCSPAPTPTSPARCSTPAASAISATSPSAASSSPPTASPARSSSSSCR